MNHNLQGKKKKKKKVKAKVNPNSYMRDESPLVHQSSMLSATGKPDVSQPQNSAALPDLDIDPLQQDDDGDGNVDWDYKDLAGAKINPQDE